jgi:hypothetical protein
MDAFHQFLMALPLSVTAGINLYMTVLVVGAAIRMGWVQDVPQGLDALASWPVLITAAVLYIINFVADKIQFVDNLSDTIHTFIRPVGAAVVVLCIVSGQADPRVAIVAALAAGGAGFVSHSGKAGLRGLVNLVSPGENTTNIVLSVAEDIFVGLVTLMAFTNPYIAFALAAAVVVVVLAVAPVLFRLGWFWLVSVVVRVRAMFGQKETSDEPPPAHAAAVGHELPAVCAVCRVQKVRWMSGRTGHLMLLEGGLAFVCTKWLMLVRTWRVPRDRIAASYFRRCWFVDVLEVHYTDVRGRKRLARFIFTRYRSPLAEAIARGLGARGLPPAAPPTETPAPAAGSLAAEG